jgi:hypothetical protein
MAKYIGWLVRRCRRHHLVVDLFSLVFCFVAQAQPVVFHIEPVRPVADLRAEAKLRSLRQKRGIFGRAS